jgi:uncharacterized protein (DUF736 family)
MSKDMSGALFRNDKGDNERRPDYRGDVTVNGVKFSLAGWKKEGAKGPYLSLSVSEWKERAPADGQSKQPPKGDLDDEIPF